MTVTVLRDEFKEGPVGLWVTRLGGGFEMTHGTNLQFRPDGTGTEWHWGHEPELDGESEFSWKPLGKCQIEITHGDEPPTIVEYDFLIRRNEYDIREDVIFQKDHWGKDVFDDNGFWISAHPLVRAGSESSSAAKSVWKHLARFFRR